MPTHRPRFLPFLSVLLSVVLLDGAWAQSQATTGVIRGLVWDQFGNPIADATVALKETRTNYERTLTSSDLGLFTATLLPLGLYDVTVQATGQAEVRQTGVQVRVGETVELIVKMLPQMAEMIVEAALPTVDITQSEPATRLPEEAVQDLPNNGRNFLNLTLLTPGGGHRPRPRRRRTELGGQRGIHNNISVDGADFNNPFFGEQRGGQRPAFTFNLDAVEEMVVVPQGANGGIWPLQRRLCQRHHQSGTNQLHGSLHFFGKNDALSGTARHEGVERTPDFSQGQFGFTMGGPLIKDKAFFFTAYDQQVFRDTKQSDSERIDARLRTFMDEQFNGALADDYGPIDRTNDAHAFLAKIDARLSDAHYATFKYNYTWSEQENGTFDVDSWTRSANAVEQDWSHAFNGSLLSLVSATTTNEFRFQVSREDRPRPYLGPNNPNTGRPFPDTGCGFCRRLSLWDALFHSGRVPRHPHPVARQHLRGQGRSLNQSWRRVEPRRIRADLHRLCQWPLHLQLARWLSQLRRAGQRLCRVRRRQHQHHRSLSRRDGYHRPRAVLYAAIRRRRADRGRGGHPADPAARIGPICAGQFGSPRTS